MIINFNIEKLNALLLDFYKLTGLTISVWDSALNQLSFQPKDMPSFCRLIKSTSAGTVRCFKSDKEICLKSLKANSPVTHRCHAGLIDTAIPIKFKDTLLGFLMFGQATLPEKDGETDNMIDKVARELKIDGRLLRASYDGLAKYQPDRIESAANILKMATRYLWLSDMIKIENDDLFEQIDEYLRENIEKKLTVDEICKRFCISKNKLYSITKERFKMSFGSYVLKLRIDAAKRMLSTTEMLVYEICSAVGIAEYNYFTKIFKKQVGVTPLQYRKNPVIIG